MPIQRLSESAYQQLVANAIVLKERHGKPAILLTPDKLIVKHIYRRSWFSSSRIWPYAQRFINGAKLLHERGILAPTVRARYYYPTAGCDILVYEYLDGKSLYTLANENNYSYVEKIPAFIAKLHDLGIYFRDLHLDNVIVHNEEFALIDLASIKCRRLSRSLNLKYRARNLAHMFEKQEDQSIYDRFGTERFLRHYAECTKLPARKLNILYKYITRRLKLNLSFHAREHV